MPFLAANLYRESHRFVRYERSGQVDQITEAACDELAEAVRGFGQRTDVEEEATHYPTQILGFGLLGVNTCPRCIEYLVFGLFECSVGKVDCCSRIVLG